MNAPITAPHALAMNHPLRTTAPKAAPRAPHVFTHRIEAGTAMSLGRRRGELAVVRGVAWVTCHDDLQDHIVEAGERLYLPDGHRAVVEAVRRDAAVLLSWRPDEPRGNGR